MKIFSPGRPVSRTRARNSAFINQLATPGLGSLLAGRYLAGTGQLLLALAGFGLVVIWFIDRMIQVWQEIDTGVPTTPISWIWEIGALIFVLSWLWALVTSLSLLRQARNESTPEPPLIPRH